MVSKGSLKYNLKSEKIQKLKKLYVTGHTVEELVRIFHINERTIRKYLSILLPNYREITRKHYLDGRKKLCPSNKKVRKMKTLFLKGHNASQIKNRMHTSTRTINKYLSLVVPDYKKIIKERRIKNIMVQVKKHMNKIDRNAKNHTVELARIIGHLQFDGHVRNDKSRHCYQAIYYNSSLQLINQFISDVKKQFGLKKVYLHKRENVYRAIFCSIELNKTLLDITSYGTFVWKVPKWIEEDEGKLRQTYLQTFFDDEGYFGYRRIEAPSCNYDGLMQIKNILASLNISSRIQKTGGDFYSINGRKGKAHRLWRIRIYGQSNLRKFRDSVGFSLFYKQNNLGNYLKRSDIQIRTRENVLKAVKSHIPVRDIIKKYDDVSHATIYNWIGRDNEASRFIRRHLQRHYPKNIGQQVIDLFNKVNSYREVMRITGIPFSNVYRWVNGGNVREY